MAKGKAGKLKSDVHQYLEDGDCEMAVDVLRQGMVATTTRRAGRLESGGFEYEEVPDHSLRLSAAKLTLEYSFGKPATKHEVNVTKSDGGAIASPSEIMQRLHERGADLSQVLDQYVQNLPVAERPLIEVGVDA